MKPGHYIGGGQRLTDEDEAAYQLAPEGNLMDGWVFGVLFWVLVAIVAGWGGYSLMQALLKART